MIPAAFDYHRAGSLDEALRLVAGNPDVKVLAGGHSLLPLLKLRVASVGSLVDIGRVPELRGIRRAADGSVAIGAMTTYRELAEDTPIDWVRDALGQIGDVQVRNRGTLGGSLAHADPASDFPAIALVFDASVVLRSASGEREVAVSDFLEGPFQTTIRPDEILVEIRRPPVPEGAGGGYAKLAQPASGYAIVGAAAVIARSGGTISHASVALTGVHEHAYRAPEVEEALMGTAGSADDVAAAVEHATVGVEVNSDIHADREYRTAMAAVYARRAIEAALARAS
jgi:aerobic carbon-monoxide dehydrogenase medium subunit